MTRTYEPAVPEDRSLVTVLAEGEGRRTVLLKDGRRLVVFNIAWGYDESDTHAHVTTNISPNVPGESIDTFCTDSVTQVLDESGSVLFDAR